ncbi:glycosyltransferase [Selenomonas sp. TAMA-11512]|uniref:MGDG synthase family glycosyltransferase n=1 Tax=Selenomonas sp. TAMA-11512 TaxID=3095337 RepID=UPI00308C313E|nr:glycosyltransferase [Selenomonas sp. TAMA-11512]
MSARSYLIAAASIGSGHLRAAEALRAAIARREPEAKVTVVDFTARDIAPITWLLKAIYLKMLRFVPDLYQRLYDFSGGKAGGGMIRELIARASAPSMERLLKLHNADVVICTHPFPEAAASRLKRNGRDFFLSVVLTDFSMHEIWIYPGVDAYFVATEKMMDGFRSLAGAHASVYATGIPVLPPASLSKEEAREQLGIAADAHVILLMGGGLGLGGMERGIADLEASGEQLTVLVAAGRNAPLAAMAREAAKQSKHIIKVWEYTEEVPRLMAAADLLITKPGGLTISEAWTRGLPLVLHEPIPGPEEENARYAVQQGTALYLKEGEKLAAAVVSLFTEGTKMHQMRAASQAASRGTAAEAIIRQIERCIAAKHSERSR